MHTQLINTTTTQEIENLLFLDIDGVLNNHDYNLETLSSTIHKDKIKLLTTIIKQTNSKIVLTSAWRYLIHNGNLTLTGFDYLLRSHGLPANTLISITRPDTMITNQTTKEQTPTPNERGQQITDWLNHHKIKTTHIAIDDLDLGITPHHHLIQTNGNTGLTTQNTQDAIELIKTLKNTQKSHTPDLPRH